MNKGLIQDMRQDQIQDMTISNRDSQQQELSYLEQTKTIMTGILLTYRQMVDQGHPVPGEEVMKKGEEANSETNMEETHMEGQQVQITGIGGEMALGAQWGETKLQPQVFLKIQFQEEDLEV